MTYMGLRGFLPGSRGGVFWVRLAVRRDLTGLKMRNDVICAYIEIRKCLVENSSLTVALSQLQLPLWS